MDLLKVSPDQRFVKEFDILLGLSLLGWAVAGIVTTWPNWQALFPVRIALALLQVWVGILIILRPPAIASGSYLDIGLSLPSFLFSGWLFAVAGPLEQWPLACKWVFVAAIGWVMLSFWYLRRSFAILPARRDIVRGGLYRIVRHPAYLGELVMGSACAIAAPSLWGWVLYAALLAWMYLRIRQEERLLGEDAAYGHYRQQVRWRLIWGVW